MNKLWSRIKLSTSVLKVERDDVRRKWLVVSSSNDSSNEVRSSRCTMMRDSSLTDGNPQATAFDRLIIATGANNKPVVPQISNSELFEGDIIHSQQFKDPSAYAGKTVIVVGSGQTATDTVEFLRLAGAKKLYMSHRRAFVLVSIVADFNAPPNSVLTIQSFPGCSRESRARAWSHAVSW